MKSSNRSGKVTYPLPKILLNWDRTAATEFFRADAFCAKWWNPETNKVQKSGDTDHDVRMRVIQAMWQYQQVKSPDAESDEEVDESCHHSVGCSEDNTNLQSITKK